MEKRQSAATEQNVWRRVSPTLEPWPGVDALGKALRDGVSVDGAALSSDAARNPDTSRALTPVRKPPSVRNPEISPPMKAEQKLTPVAHPASVPDLQGVERAFSALPGAQPDPCCMGTEAEPDLAVIAGFAEDEQSEQRQERALSGPAPTWARPTLLTLAAHAAARQRRLLAAYYLISGDVYFPDALTERVYVGKWRPALRERYHALACAAMNYARAADGTPDPCLNALFEELSADAFQCAAAVEQLLERSLMG